MEKLLLLFNKQYLFTENKLENSYVERPSDILMVTVWYRSFPTFPVYVSFQTVFITKHYIEYLFM